MTKGTRKAYRRPQLRSRIGRALDTRRAHRLSELGGTQLEANHPDHAAEVLKSALVLDPTVPNTRIQLATALYRAGDFEESLAWLAEVPSGNRAKAELLRGQVLADLRDYRGARQAFGRALTSKPDLVEARIRRAAVRIASGDPASALADLDVAVEHLPTSTWARTLRAAARIEAGQPVLAMEDLSKIRSTDQSAHHVLLHARAALLAGRGDREVDRVFLDGVQQHPADGRLRVAFARHLAARSSNDPQAASQATAELERLIARDRTLPRKLTAEAIFLLAELTAGNPDEFDRTESLYHRGLGIDPDAPAGLSGLGSLLLDHGRPAQALPWLLRSIMVDPDRPRTVELLARALPVMADDDAVARWLGLMISGLPQESPRLLARLVRYVQESGRGDAYEDIRRQAHRMKNRVAVLASRARLEPGKDGLYAHLDGLYEEWARFLRTIRLRPPAPKLFSPAQLVRRAVEQSVSDQQRLTTDLPSGLPLIKGDEEQLVDALANILTNALQASPEEALIRIRVRSRESNRWIEVAITDEGQGITPEDRVRIFEPGFSSKESGSGVGLAVSRRAVLSHGGRISVASTPGGPTTFTTRLPAAGSVVPSSLQPFETMAMEQMAGPHH